MKFNLKSGLIYGFGSMATIWILIGLIVSFVGGEFVLKDPSTLRVTFRLSLIAYAVGFGIGGFVDNSEITAKTGSEVKGK